MDRGIITSIGDDGSDKVRVMKHTANQQKYINSICTYNIHDFILRLKPVPAENDSVCSKSHRAGLKAISV